MHGQKKDFLIRGVGAVKSFVENCWCTWCTAPPDNATPTGQQTCRRCPYTSSRVLLVYHQCTAGARPPERDRTLSPSEPPPSYPHPRRPCDPRRLFQHRRKAPTLTVRVRCARCRTGHTADVRRGGDVRRRLRELGCPACGADGSLTLD